MAIAKGTRARVPSDDVDKVAVYEAIFALNRDLGMAVAGFRRLYELGFRREFMDAYAVKLEELRCAANVELFETQKDREMQEWVYWSGLNREWERQFCDENDVLIEAEMIRKKQAGKK